MDRWDLYKRGMIPLEEEKSIKGKPIKATDPNVEGYCKEFEGDVEDADNIVKPKIVKKKEEIKSQSVKGCKSCEEVDEQWSDRDRFDSNSKVASKARFVAASARERGNNKSREIAQNMALRHEIGATRNYFNDRSRNGYPDEATRKAIKRNSCKNCEEVDESRSSDQAAMKDRLARKIEFKDRVRRAEKNSPEAIKYGSDLYYRTIDDAEALETSLDQNKAVHRFGRAPHSAYMDQNWNSENNNRNAKHVRDMQVTEKATNKSIARHRAKNEEVDESFASDQGALKARQDKKAAFAMRVDPSHGPVHKKIYDRNMDDYNGLVKLQTARKSVKNTGTADTRNHNDVSSAFNRSIARKNEEVDESVNRDVKAYRKALEGKEMASRAYSQSHKGNKLHNTDLQPVSDKKWYYDGYDKRGKYHALGYEVPSENMTNKEFRTYPDAGAYDDESGKPVYYRSNSKTRSAVSKKLDKKLGRTNEEVDESWELLSKSAKVMHDNSGLGKETTADQKRKAKLASKVYNDTLDRDYRNKLKNDSSAWNSERTWAVYGDPAVKKSIKRRASKCEEIDESQALTDKARKVLMRKSGEYRDNQAGADYISRRYSQPEVIDAATAKAKKSEREAQLANNIMRRSQARDKWNADKKYKPTGARRYPTVTQKKGVINNFHEELEESKELYEKARKKMVKENHNKLNYLAASRYTLRGEDAEKEWQDKSAKAAQKEKIAENIMRRQMKK